ncbi:MAG: thioredoxin domain-containing protein [Anaerolineae bacterium]|nr:thioredoxin domain-containing protein [Anaerolineae bacterium]
METIAERRLNRYSEPLSALIIFVLGAALGGGFVHWLLLATPQTISPQQAKVVLVLQTATPEASLAAPQNQLAQPPTTLPPIEATAALEGAPDYARMGDATAPVQLVVFADPQCPYCAQQALETEPKLMEQYVKTGKAALTYRHFTFLGDESQRMAVAMVCAGQQGRDAFWAFHHRAFQNQLAENSGQVTEDVLLDWAQAVKLDEAQFKTCLGSDAARQQVEADTALGHRLRVTGTPTLFINGRALPGALSFEFVKGVVDEVLAATNAQPTDR